MKQLGHQKTFYRENKRIPTKFDRHRGSLLNRRISGADRLPSWNPVEPSVRNQHLAIRLTEFEIALQVRRACL